MLSVLIGNDIEDINKLKVIVDKLDVLVTQDCDQEILEAFNWLKNIQNILTDTNYAQEMYDVSDLLN